MLDLAHATDTDLWVLGHQAQTRAAEEEARSCRSCTKVLICN